MVYNRDTALINSNLWLLLPRALHCSLYVWVLLQMPCLNTKGVPLCARLSNFFFFIKWVTHQKSNASYSCISFVTSVPISQKNDFLLVSPVHFFSLLHLKKKKKNVLNSFVLFALISSLKQRDTISSFQTFDTMPHCCSVTQCLKLCLALFLSSHFVKRGESSD